MRNYLFISALFLACLSSPFYSNADIGSDCRDAIANLEFTSPEKALRQDLLSGKWTLNTACEQKILDFHSFGLVDIYTIEQNKSTEVQSYVWRTITKSYRPVLMIMDPGTHEAVYYEAEQLCEGIILNSKELESSQLLEFNPTLSEGELNKIKENITGDWKTDIDHSVMVHYIFRQDGSYTRFLGNSENKITEHGFWNISDDGRYLVFKITDDKKVEGVFKTIYAKIVENSAGKLSLEQPICIAGMESVFKTNSKVHSYKRIMPIITTP